MACIHSRILFGHERNEVLSFEAISEIKQTQKCLMCCCSHEELKKIYAMGSKEWNSGDLEGKGEGLEGSWVASAKIQFHRRSSSAGVTLLHSSLLRTLQRARRGEFHVAQHKNIKKIFNVSETGYFSYFDLVIPHCIHISVCHTMPHNTYNYCMSVDRLKRASHCD